MIFSDRTGIFNRKENGEFILKIPMKLDVDAY